MPHVPYTLFLGNALLGRGVAAPHPLHGPWHRAWFCPHCGEIWARAVVDLPNIEWQVWHGLCPRHASPSWFTIAGSLWSEYEPEFSASLPPAALQRELAIHFTHFDKHANSYP